MDDQVQEEVNAYLRNVDGIQKFIVRMCKVIKPQGNYIEQ